MTEEGETMTTREVCAALKISRKTLYAWVRKGWLQPLPGEHPIKRRQPRKWLRADVERLMRPPAS